MSIASEISRLNTAKADIKTAIQNKGVSVPSSTKIDGYPSLINQIQTFDPYNGHAYVEIGGLKWATMNIGASSVTDYGQYFQWGDTTGYNSSQVGSTSSKKPFELKDYKFGKGDDGIDLSLGATKYSLNDEKEYLDLSDDAARANWGGSWRIPTTAELQALGNAVNSVWTTSYQGSGVAGIVCTDKTDSSKVLFFPAAGRLGYESASNVGTYGWYWLNSINQGYPPMADCLFFKSDQTHWQDYGSPREYGFSVRGVVG